MPGKLSGPARNHRKAPPRRHARCPPTGALGHSVRGVRRGGAFDDPMFVRCGVRRVVGRSDSGRDFLPQHREVFDGTLARATFFDGLHSGMNSSRRWRIWRRDGSR